MLILYTIMIFKCHSGHRGLTSGWCAERAGKRLMFIDYTGLILQGNDFVPNLNKSS